MRTVAVTWEQEKDSCDPSDEPQKFRACVDDAGGGVFLVVSTERWAMSDAHEIDQLAEAMKAFLSQAQDDA